MTGRLSFLAVSVLCLIAASARAEDTLLIRATKQGDLESVQGLLSDGVDPNQFDKHYNTALIFAARDGHTEIAKALIAAGATVDWVDGEGVTPLILAAFKNHQSIVTLLLDQNADTEIRDKWNRNALDYALRRGSDDPIAVMLQTSDR